jgi:D-ribose pyranose/furanose isomerase RbsD
VKDAEVIISTFPGTPSYKKNTLFKNTEVIHDFGTVLSKLTPHTSLVFHIPEYAIARIAYGLIPHKAALNRVSEFTINILNQNMELMPPPEITASLYTLSPNLITQTTAHKRYTTQDLANTYNTPVMNLSVFIDSSQYVYTDYDKKENIVAYSNDQHPDKGSIIQQLKNKLTHYSFVEISGLSYEEYKELAAQAKYIITFGEGFDGYLIEGIFSGGITFAVYNETFFASKEFLQYENIYQTYDDMRSNIAKDIIRLDSKTRYQNVNQKNFNTLSKIYDYKIYLNNLKEFYSNKFTYIPSQDASRLFFSNALSDREQQISKLDHDIYEKDLQIQSQAQDLNRVNTLLLELGSQLVDLQRINESQTEIIERIQKTIFYKVFKKIKNLKKSLLKTR